MEQNYPIQPKHLDTSHEPKGFDVLLSYDQRVILWAFFQFWQARGNWDSFTHKEFVFFINHPESRVNDAIRSGILWFMESRLKSLLDYIEDETGKDHTYGPTHSMISTYFQWNPAQDLF